MSGNQTSSNATVFTKDDAASIKSASTVGSTTRLLKDQTGPTNSSGSSKSNKDSADHKKVADSTSILRAQMNMNF